MKRKIISINEDMCNGCGLCIPDCPEGALQLIDGKARLVSDLFCDGLGACIGTCPEDAITVIEREAEAYSEERVMENIIPQGGNVIRAHLEHLKDHGEMELYNEAVAILERKGVMIQEEKSEAPQPAMGGCLGSMAMSMERQQTKGHDSGAPVQSELRQWPVQLKLINPAAPYLDNAHLLLAADCAPVVYGNFHRDFIRDKVVIMFCPKLDPYMDEYLDKLTHILSSRTIKTITVARMEVPCCGGISALLQEALRRAESHVPVYEQVISIQGEVK